MKFFDLFDDRLYYEMVEKGYVKTQIHPTAPYVIHNYTDACTWDQEWNEVTLQCRGLITHAETDEIIARPMRKFFNHDQEQAPKLELDDQVMVFDKADGSLGILYRLPDGEMAIATRGSFTSEQAIWATNWLRERGTTDALWRSDLTYMFEIIYPENRVVVDYQGFEGLVLLGAIHKETGAFNVFHDSMYNDAVASFDVFKTFGDVLSAPPRDNAEGFVVHKVATGEMVKIKYEDYKRLHRYMTRVTERHVWECLMGGRDLEAEFAGAPDEFHDWVKEVAKELDIKFWSESDRIHEEHLALVKNLPAQYDRKTFAMSAKNSKDSASLFLLEDARDIDIVIWKKLKPEARTFKVVSSDAD